MNRLLKKQNGFTLVEVIVAVTILLVIAFAFVPLFSTTFANIFAYGEKDRAMSFASDQMEELYAIQPLSSNPDEAKSEVEDKLEEGVHIEDRDNLYKLVSENNNYGADWKFNYYLGEKKPVVDDDNIEGYQVDVVVFYHDGERYVELTSFVRSD